MIKIVFTRAYETRARSVLVKQLNNLRRMFQNAGGGGNWFIFVFWHQKPTFAFVMILSFGEATCQKQCKPVPLWRLLGASIAANIILDPVVQKSIFPVIWGKMMLKLLFRSSLICPLFSSKSYFWSVFAFAFNPFAKQFSSKKQFLLLLGNFLLSNLRAKAIFGQFLLLLRGKIA